MQHHPRKRFGQHFLQDPLIIDQIISAIGPKKDDFIVEIGPGRGALTIPLLTMLDSLSVIELDRDLAALLNGRAGLTLYQQDVLQFDFSSLPAVRIRVVGNIPYNISTALLFHLIKYRDRICDLVFMLQKEVAERICAAPATTNYSRLSVMCQTYYQTMRLFDVRPAAFRPPPKVNSTVVRLIPIRDNSDRIKHPEEYAKIVKKAFSKRRKTIHNALKPLLDDADFQKLAIKPNSRAENLSIDDYIHLVTYYVTDKQR